MSEKVLKLAGKRPMLLALIILTAMLTFGLLFSGWLTPTPSKAQQGMETNSPPSQEDTDCVTASQSSSCVSAGSVSLVAPTNSPVICIGSSVSLSASYLMTTGRVLVTTTYTNANPNSTNSCDDTYSTNYSTPTIVSNWWNASVGSFNASGSGLTASFTPTNCGSGSVTFHLTYQNSDPCDTNIQSAGDVSGSFTVHRTTITFDDTPSRGPAFWPCTWAAKLEAVCVSGTNNTSTSYSTSYSSLASITYQFSVDVSGVVTMSKSGDGNAGDINKIIVTGFTPNNGTAGIHIEAYYIGCCDSGQMNWVQTITATSAPPPGKTPPYNDCFYGPPTQAPYYFGWPPGDSTWSSWDFISNHTTTCP